MTLLHAGGHLGGGHLGDRVAALVDGQLPATDRDRALAHLAGCPGCRAEVAEHRALKARLDHLGAVRAPGGLEDRLRALGGAPGAPAPPLRPAPPPPPARRRAGLAGLAGLAGGGLLVAAGLGVVAAAADGGRAARPVDPGRAAFVVEHATTAGQVPLADPAVGAVARVQPVVSRGIAGGR